MELSPRLDPVGIAEPVGEVVLGGVSHHALTVELRELVALRDDEIQESIMLLREHGAGIREAVLLSTCNRTEVVAVIESTETARRGGVAAFRSALSKLLQARAAERARDLLAHLYVKTHREAAVHLFRVASGLDSQVLGEPQILGQVKSAYELAQRLGEVRSVLHRLFHRAFSVAKTVRTRTNIGRNPVSVCYAARKVGEEIFGDLSETALLVLGTGEMARLAVRHFLSAGGRRFYVASRHWERACEFAELFGGVAVPRERVPDFLPKVELVIGATNRLPEELPVISLADVQSALEARRGALQFYVDLGVPRNFESTLGDLGDLFLYTLDDLAEIVRENMDRRFLELEAGESLVEEEADRFMLWLEEQRIAPAIGDVRHRLLTFGETEIRKTVRRLRALGFSEESLELLSEPLKRLVEGMVKKILHHPLSVVKFRGRVDPELVKHFVTLFLDQAIVEKEPSRPVSMREENAEIPCCAPGRVSKRRVSRRAVST